MSFILDALKKSETERQRQGSAEFATIPASRAVSSPPRWLWVLVLLLLINLVVLAGILLHDEPAATTPASSPPASSPPAVAPAVTPAATPADTGQPPAAGTASFEARIADARRRQPPPSVVEEVTPAPEPAPTDEIAEQRPPATQPNESASASASETETETLSLPTLTQLRVGGILNLPDLHLDIHVYSETPADRFVFVNMSKHREHSRLASGPVVERITPEGVVLDYQGTRFLLPRE